MLPPLLSCYSLDYLGWQLLNQPFLFYICFSFHPCLLHFPHGVYNYFAVSCAFCLCMYVCMYVFIKLHITTQSGPVILVILCHSHWSSRGGINDTYYENLWSDATKGTRSLYLYNSYLSSEFLVLPDVCMYVCMYVCIFIKLHIITAQSGPVILVILCMWCTYVCMYVCMSVCMIKHIARVWINRVRLPILLVVSWTGKNEHFPVRVRAWEFGLAGQVRQSRPAYERNRYILRTSSHLTHVNNNGDNISKTIYSTPSTILCTLNSFLYIQVLSLVYSASNFRKNVHLKHSLGNLVHIQPPKIQPINSTPFKPLGLWPGNISLIH